METSVLLDRVSKATGEVKEQILAKGVVEYLRLRLREVNAEMIAICDRYHVASSKEMEKKYETGELVEEGTWRDLFRLSHLEERKETFEKLLEEASVD